MKRTLLLALVLVVLAAPDALACETCYGAGPRSDGTMVTSARLGVALLLAVTVAVQGAFLMFFLHLRRQARRAASEQIDAEWSQMQHELVSGRRTLEHP